MNTRAEKVQRVRLARAVESAVAMVLYGYPGTPIVAAPDRLDICHCGVTFGARRVPTRDEHAREIGEDNGC
jgi:hypothetical protein